LENPNEYKYVNHIDGNKTNNHVKNLEWTTQKKKNIQHALKTGLITVHTRKVKKYSLENVFIQDFNSVDEAAASIGLTRHSIIRACNKKNKTAGGFIWNYTANKTVDVPDSAINIENYPNYYVDNEGNIYSKKSRKCLKGMKNASGYVYVTLCANRKKKNMYVHRLVAKYFIDNLHNKKYVNHIDFNKSNNNVKNLEWVTHSENVIHANNK